MYLIFPNKQEAIDRADAEGKKMKFSYWTKGKGTRWLTEPVPTADEEWALDVSKYNLNKAEKSSTEDRYNK